MQVNGDSHQYMIIYPCLQKHIKMIELLDMPLFYISNVCNSEVSSFSTSPSLSLLQAMVVPIYLSKVNWLILLFLVLLIS